MKKYHFLWISMIGVATGLAFSETDFSIAGISISGNPCGDGIPGRIVVESGHLKLSDTLVVDSTYLPLSKRFPMRELEVSGYIVCREGNILLDAVTSKEPTQRENIDLGHGVKIFLSSRYRIRRDEKGWSISSNSGDANGQSFDF
jgi:hypothetical protein